MKKTFAGSGFKPNGTEIYVQNFWGVVLTTPNCKTLPQADKLCDRTDHGSESRLAPMLIVNAKIVMLKKNTMTQ
jgi:hypothetical protein